MLQSRILAIAGLLACASIGCESGPITLRFDVGTSAEERQAVIDVIPAWNAETLPEAQIIVADDGDELVSFVDRIVAGGRLYDGRECTDEGKDCARDRWVRIRRGMSPEQTRRIARHELGHVLGMHHLAGDEVGVMNGDAPADELAEPDRALCRATHACPMIIGRPMRIK